MLRAVVIVAVLTIAARAHGDDDVDDLATRTLVFARGTSLIKADGKGRGESVLATLPDKRTVRVLRTDAFGKVLLADIGGTWAWMPLDGSTKTLTDLPCGPGPAQLATDGLCVLCRAKAGTGSIIVTLKSGRVTPVDVPATGARLTGSGAERRLVWADANGVWSAPAGNRKQAKKVAPQPPLRALSPSPDGKHAAGVYNEEVFDGPKQKTTGEVLVVFALDGVGARRKAIQNGIPVEWSHDGKWLLVQDRNNACVMLGAGGQYKCWRGYTAQSISPDGNYALVLGNRDRGGSSDKKKKKKKKDKKQRSKRDKAKKQRKAEPAEDSPTDEAELPGDEHGDEPVAIDEVPVAPPSGPLALYRAEVTGPYTKTPPRVTPDVDGAAVWIPTAP